MHSSTRVSPFRTILVLVVPKGNMKPGRRSPSGLPEDTGNQRQIETLNLEALKTAKRGVLDLIL